MLAKTSHKHIKGRSVGILPPRPISKFDIRWNEPLGNKEKPYMYRYMINLWLFSIRLHIWHDSDDTRALHDHAFDFVTIVLRGCYFDVTDIDNIEFSKYLRKGSIRFRKAEHKHFVGWPKPGTITLLFCGPKRRKWGFYPNGRENMMRPLRYFSRYGHE